jgi:hypothetical protein
MDNDRAARTAQNRQRAREAERERETDESIKLIMSRANGRRFFYWLLSLGRPGQNPFTGNTLSTMFNCGELNVAQRVTDRLLRICPDFYVLMLKEMEDERLADARNTSALAASSDDGADEFGEHAAD